VTHNVVVDHYQRRRIDLDGHVRLATQEHARNGREHRCSMTDWSSLSQPTSLGRPLTAGGAGSLGPLPDSASVGRRTGVPRMLS
jgi:hypothetical protein